VAALALAALVLALAALPAARAQSQATETPDASGAGGPSATSQPPANQPPANPPPGGPPSTNQAPATEAGPGGTLTVWTTYQGAALTWLEEQTRAYGGAFDRHVEVTAMKLGDIKQKAALNAKKGTAADLFVGIPHDQFSALADDGVLADMSDFATQTYLDGLSPQAARAFRYLGTLYGLPLSVEGPALIVNTNLVSDLPTSYPALKKLAASLTGGGRYGFAFDAANFYYAYAWIRTFGGYVFGANAQGGPDTNDIGLASPGSVAGARELKALRFQDGLLPPEVDYGAIQKLFLAGKVAMTYDGPWLIPAIVKAHIPVTVVPMPPLADGTPWRGLMNVDGVLLNRFSGDKVGAANLAKWLTQPTAQADLATRTGRIPASRQALARVKGDAVLTGFGDALADSVAIPNVPAMGAVWGPMDAALGTILGSPDSDVAGALQHAVSAVSGP